jgi:hypothetical protein
MKRYIDPPAGWRYGFPKVLPDNVQDINAWLVSEGYPQDIIDTFPDGVPCNQWYEPDTLIIDVPLTTWDE